MSTLSFFPWLRIKAETELGPYRLVPYERGKQPFGSQRGLQESIDEVLQPYRVRGEIPVEKATIIYTKDREVTADLTDEELNALFVFSELLALCALSKRQFFSTIASQYCNRELLRLYVQRFTGTKGVSVTNRRRDGVTLSYITGDAYRVYKPSFVAAPFQIQFDEPLLSALLTAQGKLRTRWTHYYESIVNFNLANTDSDTIPLHVEVVFTLAAFERLLGVVADGKRLAREFVTSLLPEEEIRPVDHARFSVVDMPVLERDCVRELWIRDLFEARGRLAHGMMNAPKGSVWTIHDHLLLSSYVYPLLLKCRLAKANLYCLTDDDQWHIDLFERLACEEHCVPRKRDEDSEEQPEEHPWQRIISEAAWRRISNPNPRIRE